jgi:hypothetical protein
MRFFRTLRCGLCALSLSACASITNSYVATPLDAQGQLVHSTRTASGLVISGEELTTYASENFGLVEVTLENQLSAWVRIERLTLDFGDSVRGGVSLTEEPDVSAWYRATVQRNDVRDANRASALGALVLVGAAVTVAGHATDEPVAKAAGGLAMAAGPLALVAKGVDEAIERAERGDVYPETHLLAVPFGVPPGLFSKRWVLINTQGRDTPCVRGMIIDYDVEGRGRERVLLRFRRRGNGSEWQRAACDTPPRPVATSAGLQSFACPSTGTESSQQRHTQDERPARRLQKKVGTRRELGNHHGTSDELASIRCGLIRAAGVPVAHERGPVAGRRMVRPVVHSGSPVAAARLEGVASRGARRVSRCLPGG